jgi:predicted short-subunit dehydrogenase-like oxidoreductase (DUF2520 family)
MIAAALPHFPVVVGRGRLGAALEKALRKAGLDPRSAGGRESRERPEDLLRLLRGNGRTPVLLLAVRDDALAPLAAGLAAVVPAATAGAAALHLSGALGPEVLRPLAARGFATAACHPLQTFTGSPVDAARFAGAGFAVEGSEEGRAAAEALVRALGGRPFSISSDARPLYHLAASLGANGLTGLVAAARDALAATGVGPEAAIAALAPLLRTALHEALRSGPEAALTGPVSRGDETTVERHRRALLAWDESRAALFEALLEEQRRLSGHGAWSPDAKMPRSE